MKKFLVILMVVAMASFLFVGCAPGVVTPDVDDEEDEEPTPPAAATETPVITEIAGIDITSSATLYINADEAAVVIVTGTARPHSEVKVYINDTVADTDIARANATFDVVMAKADLGTDGAKTLHVTATETGFDESADSNECAFTLDTVAPGISAVKATAEIGWENSVSIPAISPLVGRAATVFAVTFSAVATTYIEPGDWTITCLLDSPAIAARTVDHEIVSPLGDVTTCELAAASTNDDLVIPGLNITLVAIGNAVTAGNSSIITVSPAGAEEPIQARATLKFDENVTLAAAEAGTYSGRFALDGAATLLALDIYQASNNTYYWVAPETGAALIDEGDLLSFSVSGIADAAGNVSSTTIAVCVVEEESLTELKPTD